ncbi:Fpg/Nei family DNA glycosylase [Sanguibacter suaedae]|uniref:DNA-(apurinic or apyrimidinic site) lyase n=1 Tax=Sanguibacter suaedae TaxID=2795737 RepID=A0A934I6C0_9MICO|nr:zinc finger domain-containing protein [Sanguibacter suaedae]MBI9115051.1 Fpg/Nei family DNA glycosylase [Sanguibacter suaedae]
MPEGHTVHRLARTFADLFAGSAVAVSSPQGRFAAGAAVLDGGTMVASEAHGKQMFLAITPRGADRSSDADVRWLRVHLGLYGAWTFAGDGSTAVVHAIGAPRKRVGEAESALPVAEGEHDAHEHDDGAWEPPGPRGQVRVRIRSEHAVADLTGPTACEVVTPEEKDAVVARLGPDPLRPDADPARFVEALRRSRSPVAGLLMNQAVVAGVGNIYRAEALFRARLAPMLPGRAVPAETAHAVWDDLVEIMTDGARTGAIVTTEPRHRGSVGAGSSQERRGRRTRQNTDVVPGAVASDDAFYVYHRDGLPCRVCGTGIALTELAGRNLFWCPRCQA